MMRVIERGRVAGLRHAVRLDLERALGLRLTWSAHSPTQLMSRDVRIVLLCAAEREDGRFAFAFHRAHDRFLEQGATRGGTRYPFVCLVCGNSDQAFLIPYREWIAWLPDPQGMRAAEYPPVVVRRTSTTFTLTPGRIAAVSLRPYRLHTG